MAEPTHPDLETFREELRVAILEAVDEVCEKCEIPLVQDKDLPHLFPVLDALAECLFLRRYYRDVAYNG